MSFKSRYSFNINPINGKVEKPKMFICDRQLNKLGEIFPVTSPRIKTNLNGADEISFTVTKNIKNYNNKDIEILNKKYGITLKNEISNQYNALDDYSIVLATGFGYFEVSPTITDNSNVVKSLSGSSLGETELSQILCTLECNTELDIARDDYTVRFLYSSTDKDASLVDLILKNAPNYTVGYVDDTIKNIQRIFSFSNQDIMSCFSEIAEEIGCIFDVVVSKDDDGNVYRQVNIYDAQYCNKCKSRNIINGVCENVIDGEKCGSTDIGGIGEDTTIKISTKNLSNEITLTPDGNMKNCFIVEGGDDIITNTISGLQPSNNNKIYMFSDETKSKWSDKLRETYEKYEEEFKDNESAYTKTLEIEYDIFDLIGYLQHSRMPSPISTEELKLHNEVRHIITEYKKYFPNGLGTKEKVSSITSRNSVVRSIFALFVDSGYSIKQENGNYSNGIWTGDLIVYQLGNNDIKATITVGVNSSTILYADDGTTETDSELTSLTVHFSEDYETYIKQTVAIETKNYEYMKDISNSNPKNWQEYSLNRLKSYSDGYQACIETLDEIISNSSLDGVTSIAKTFRNDYYNIKLDLENYMNRLESFIYHLYGYYGSYDNSDDSDNNTVVPSSQDIDYNKYDDSIYDNNTSNAFKDMVHYIKYGTVSGGSESQKTDHPIYCKKCGSTTVTLDGCVYCEADSSHIISYGTLADEVYKAYLDNSKSLKSQRKAISDNFDLKVRLDKVDKKLYSELCSYIREDVYQNSNYISDGLTGNFDLINKCKELLEKAKQELAKACVSQHTLSGDIHSFVAYSELNSNDFPIQNVYDKFRLGNFMRYFCDDKMYKLRLSSEEFIWNDDSCELNVEFTDVVRFSNGEISDLTSLVQSVNGLATSFNSVKSQVNKADQVSKDFQKIKDEGLQSALSNVLSASNIDVQIDERGILLRKYDYDLEDYSPYQMKLINRNIVMTKDNWKSASLAIGLGNYNGEPKYGIWADLLFGDLIVGNELIIKNKNKNGESSVVIDGDGITIKNGNISWDKVNAPTISDIDNLENYLTGGGTTKLGQDYVISPKIGGGYLFITGESGGVKNSVIIDPKHQIGEDYVFAVKHGDTCTVGIKPNGSAEFSGTVNAKKGNIAGWQITETQIYTKNDDPSTETVEQLYLDATDCHIASRYNYVYDDSEAAGIPMFYDEYKMTSINKGDVLCSWNYKQRNHSSGSSSGGFLGERKIIMNAEDGIVYNDDLRNHIIYRLGATNFEVNCDFHYKGTEIIKAAKEAVKDEVSYTTTGINSNLGTGGWKQYTVSFGVTYLRPPLVNVMGTTAFSSENIYFGDFIQNSNGYYTGFSYYVNCQDTSFTYGTRWSAVGNIKS